MVCRSILAGELTANQKSAIIRGGFCDVAQQMVSQGSTKHMHHLIVRVRNDISANYEIDRDEAAKLWEQERLASLAGRWSYDTCPVYQAEAKALLQEREQTGE